MWNTLNSSQTKEAISSKLLSIAIHFPTLEINVYTCHTKTQTKTNPELNIRCWENHKSSSWHGHIAMGMNLPVQPEPVVTEKEILSVYFFINKKKKKKTKGKLPTS